MAKKKQHAHRILREDERVECECGRDFDTDADWRKHYERETTAKQREQLEWSDPETEPVVEHEEKTK